MRPIATKWRRLLRPSWGLLRSYTTPPIMVLSVAREAAKPPLPWATSSLFGSRSASDVARSISFRGVTQIWADSSMLGLCLKIAGRFDRLRQKLLRGVRARGVREAARDGMRSGTTASTSAVKRGIRPRTARPSPAGGMSMAFLQAKRSAEAKHLACVRASSPHAGTWWMQWVTALRAIRTQEAGFRADGRSVRRGRRRPPPGNE